MHSHNNLVPFLIVPKLWKIFVPMDFFMRKSLTNQTTDLSKIISLNAKANVETKKIQKNDYSRFRILDKNVLQ